MSAGASAWQDWRRIWRAAVTCRNPAAVEWGGRIALLLALAAGMARLAGVLEHDRFWRAELFIAGGWFVMLWINLFLPASILMNSAPNARLVPRLRLRLLQMTGASCMVLPLGAALVIDSWRAFPLFAVYTLGTLLSRAGMRSGIALIVLGAIWPLAGPYLPPALVHAVTAPGALLAESALLIACTALSLRLVYPDGGDRHLDGRARIVDSIHRYEKRAVAAGPDTPGFMRWSYAPALQRACRLRDPAALLMHVMGPGAHWSTWLPVLAILASVGAAMRLLLTTYSGATLHALGDWLMGFGTGTSTVMVAFGTAQFAQQLRRTRGEQALLRLTPLAGDAALLNRRLAAGMIKAGLVNWAILSTAIVGVTWLLGGPAGLLLRQLALCCLGGQLAMSGLLGDHARALASFDLRRLALLALQAACNVALAFGLSRLGGNFWIWLTPVAIAGWAALVAGQRRRMLVALPAYPVERLE